MAANDGGTDGSMPVADDLIVVSNRQPYTHSYEHDDEGERRITVNRPAGGLTAGLDPVMQETDGTWVAWGDGEADADVTD
jgi:trehalose 6-phosphate synthase